MHQIRFRLGLRPPQTPLGSSQRSPRPLAGFQGPTSKGEGRERGRKGREGEREVKGREEKQGRIKASRGPRPKYFAGPHIHTFIVVPTV